MAQVTPSTNPAPLWLAWRIFHDSLAFYNQKSAAGVEKMLAAQFGMTNGQATAFLNAGQSYVVAIRQIDAQTRAAVKSRYMPVLSGNKPPAGSAIPTSPQSFLQLAINDGLYAQMEGLNQNALAAHLNALKGPLTDTQINQISAFVQANVLPKIHTVNVGPQGATKGLPPGFSATPPKPQVKTQVGR